MQYIHSISDNCVHVFMDYCFKSKIMCVMNSCEVIISQHSIYFMNSRFPDFTSEDVLMQFSGSIKKGKAGGDYQALVERALKAELAEDNNHSKRT